MPLWVKAVGLAVVLIAVGAALSMPSMAGIGFVILAFVALPAYFFGRRGGMGGGRSGGTVDEAMAERDRAIQQARIGGERFVQQMRQRETIRGKQAVAQAKLATAALEGKWVS